MSIQGRILLVTLATALSIAPGAGAAVRTAMIHDGIDGQDTTPSLAPKPPTLEVTDARVDYDDAGTVTVSVTYNFPPGSHADSAVSLLGSKACADEYRIAVGPPPKLTIYLSSERYSSPQQGKSRASLDGYDSQIEAPTLVSTDGLTLTATFTHQAFARRDYRCVDAADYSASSGSDDFFGYFTGFEPQSMTPAEVTKFVDAELGRRYAARWISGEGKWLRCPEEELWEGDDTEDNPAWGLCEFRFRDGARWRHGSVSLKLEDGYLAVDYFSSGTFSKALKTCRIRRNIRQRDPQVLDRRLRADGFVSCQDGPASMIRDVHQLTPGVHRVGFHGTNRAGFEASSVFRCVIKRRGRRYTATCANDLGDRFVYRYTLRRKPKPRPHRHQSGGGGAGSGCDPNYSGACLNPNSPDYDCAGGSGNGPDYVSGPISVVGSDHYDLDSDGDGVACE